MKRIEIHRKHNEKRKVISISVYEKDQKIMIKKFGFLLNATQAKAALLTNKITILEKKDNMDAKLIILELKRVGNNINQIAHISNLFKQHVLENEVNEQLKELKLIVRKAEEILYFK